jgi:hypothetical protein
VCFGFYNASAIKTQSCPVTNCCFPRGQGKKKFWSHDYASRPFQLFFPIQFFPRLLEKRSLIKIKKPLTLTIDSERMRLLSILILVFLPFSKSDNFNKQNHEKNNPSISIVEKNLIKDPNYHVNEFDEVSDNSVVAVSAINDKIDEQGFYSSTYVTLKSFEGSCYSSYVSEYTSNGVCSFVPMIPVITPIFLTFM